MVSVRIQDMGGISQDMRSARMWSLLSIIIACRALDTWKPGARRFKVTRDLMGITIWILKEKWEKKPVLLTAENIVSIRHVGLEISQMLAMLVLACSLETMYMYVNEPHHIDL